MCRYVDWERDFLKPVAVVWPEVFSGSGSSLGGLSRRFLEGLRGTQRHRVKQAGRDMDHSSTLTGEPVTG